MTDYVATSFKVELLTGVHDFTNSTGHAFKWALFTNAWTGNSASTTGYTATNETSGTNYTAGGTSTANVTPSADGTTAITDWPDPTWTSASITARFTQLYNSSVSNKAVASWDFGTDQTASGGNFVLVLPAAAAATAILRLA